MSADRQRAVELLELALVAEGFGDLCGHRFRLLSQAATGWTAAAAFVVPTVLTLWTQVAWWAGLPYLILVFAIAWEVGRKDREGAAFGLLMVGGWALTLVSQAITAGPTGLIVTHGIVLALLALVAFFRLDLRALARSAPLLAPLTLLVLLVPLLTADVWQTASAVSVIQLLGLGALLIGPTLMVLQRRLARSLNEIYVGTTKELDDSQAASLLQEAVTGASSAADAKWLSTALPTLSADPVHGRNLAEDVASGLRKHFTRTLARRLLPTVVAFGSLGATYLYAVACLAVARSAAADWSKVSIGSAEIDLVVSVSLPTGPYLKVAVFLGIVATAIFMALVLTEERYSTALTGALLREPAAVSLCIGVPYLSLTREEATTTSEPDFRGEEITVQRSGSSATTWTS